MRKLGWLSLSVVAGCYQSFTLEPSPGDAGRFMRRDAGVVPARDAGPDPRPDACDDTILGWTVGSACRAGLCLDPLLCAEETEVNIQSLNVDGSTGPLLAAAISPGSECMNYCVLEGEDTCGDCAQCSQVRVGAVDFSAGVDPSGLPQGFCRSRCTFDVATNGGCRPGYTCSEAGACVEACASDFHCQFGVLDPDGDGVPMIYHLGDDHPAFCDAATGRCTTI